MDENNMINEMSMDKIYLSIAETMGTDGDFYSEVYLSKTSVEAFNMCCSLIADMAETMKLKDIDPEMDWVLEGDGWFFRVRTEEHEI